MTKLPFFESHFGRVSIIENSISIIYTEFYSNEKFNIEQAKEIDSARFELCNGKAFYSLVNLKSVYGHMTKEAQYFLANESKCSQLIKYETIIINTLSIRLLVESYMRFTKPPYEIKVVKEYDKGVELLLTQIMDHGSHSLS